MVSSATEATCSTELVILIIDLDNESFNITIMFLTFSTDVLESSAKLRILSATTAKPL